MHDETKGLILFSPKAVMQQIKGGDLWFNYEGEVVVDGLVEEHDFVVDLIEEIEAVPAAHPPLRT